MSEPSRNAPPIASVEDLLAWTEGRDEKWQLYQRLASLRHYVLLDQERIRAEAWDRLDEGGGWRYRLLDDPDAAIELAALDLKLPLRALREDALPVAGDREAGT